eukprot:5677450-Pyramimonas_sp.AAC.1
MGSQEGALGRTEDLRLPERSKSVAASTRRPNSENLPRRQASQTVFDLAEGDSSVDSVTRYTARKVWRSQNFCRRNVWFGV